VTSAFVAEGNITLSGNGMRLSSTSQGFDLASGGGVSILANGVQTAASIWAAGAVSLAGNGAGLACGIYGDSVSMTGEGTRVAACG
jgi:hypothetical protein